MNKYLKRIKSNSYIKSVFGNFALKPIAMVLSFLYTPMLLQYLGDEKYGVWATILSIINWISIADIGIGNGLRNTAAKEFAHQDYPAITDSFSTAYIALTGIMTTAILVGVGVSPFMNWNHILNTSFEVTYSVGISFIFICVNFSLKIYNAGYYIIQKSEMIPLANVLVQLLNLIIVFVLLQMRPQGNRLLHISIMFGLTQFVIDILFTVNLWKRHIFFMPSFKLFKKEKLRDICNVGLKFFVIQIAVVVLFTTDNLIITQVINPSAVTAYSTVMRFFAVSYSVFLTFLAPFWSRCTVAQEQGDYNLIYRYFNKYRILWLLFVIGLIVGIIIFKPFARIWLGTELSYDPGIIVTVALYEALMIYVGICSTILNGLGCINLQMAISVIAMIVNIPLSILLAVNCSLGTVGVCLGTIVPNFVGCIAYTIQLKSILKKGRQK